MTSADIRKTIEWVFKVRDEVTPAVKGITQTTEEAKAGMEGLIAVQDSTASSAEALRATLSDTRAEASSSTSEAQRLAREALRAKDEADARTKALMGERDALKAVLSEGLEAPEVDLSKVREGIAEAERLADVRVEIQAPSVEPVREASAEAVGSVEDASAEMQRLMADIGAMLSEGLEGPDLSAMEDARRKAEALAGAVASARAEMDLSLEVPAPDTTEAMAAVGRVKEAVAEPVAMPPPDVAEAEQAIDGVHREASGPYSMAVPDTTEAEAEIRSIRAGVESAIAQIDAEIEAESQRAQELADQAATAIATSQAEARTEIQATSAEMDAQSSKITNQLVAIGALKGGVSAMIGGVQQLGIVSDDTAQVLGKINAAFGIMAGAAGTIKAIQGAMAALNVATAINASLNSFNAVLQNPAMLAGVGLAAGAAIGVAGTYLVMQNDQSRTSTTINVVDGSEGRSQFGAEVYDVITGGAL